MAEAFKILIIDDEEIVLDACSDILTDSRFEIATARNGAQGLEMLPTFAPDLVFVDLKMPGISGLEVLENIQRIDPRIVTIVITGFATVNSAIEAMKQGAYDFLPKPFSPDEFRLITHRGLEKRKLVLDTIALRREKELLRNNFAAIVSHELKSPLSAVQQNLFNLEYELSEILSPDQSRRLGRMKTRIGELLELIQTWLRVSKFDLEILKDQFTPLSIEEIIHRSVESVEPRAVRKDIAFDIKILEPLSQVKGESGTLTEALVNLNTNAIKYSHPGSTVIITAEEEKNMILIEVKDAGVGISEDELPLIFDDFFRGKSNTTGISGAGLGLALCRRIIETHGGSISAESIPGQGSTFSIRLPVIKNTEDNQAFTQPITTVFSRRQR